jgi:hypothetical protein
MWPSGSGIDRSGLFPSHRIDNDGTVTIDPQADRRTDTTGSSTPRYRAPTLRIYGTVSELTGTAANGPNFDGGGGADVYAS